MIATLESERKALLASAVVLMGLALIAASAMHLVEHDARPDKFGSMRNDVVGDRYAQHCRLRRCRANIVLGRIVAGFTMLAGVMMLAAPIGIIANTFAEAIHRRDCRRDLGHDLVRKPFPAETIIIHHGQSADCMYFIASREVEVEAAPRADAARRRAVLRRDRPATRFILGGR